MARCPLEQELLDIKDQAQFLKDKRKIQKTQMQAKEQDFWDFFEQTGKDFNKYWKTIWAHNPTSYKVTKIEAKINSLERHYLLVGNELKDLRPEMLNKDSYLLADYDISFHHKVTEELKGIPSGDPKVQKAAKEILDTIDALNQSSMKFQNKETTVDDIIHLDVQSYIDNQGNFSPEMQSLVNKVLKGEEKSSKILDLDPSAIAYVHDLYSSIQQQIKSTSIKEIETMEFGGNADTFGKALVKKINEDPRMEGKQPYTLTDDIHKYVTETLEHTDPSAIAKGLMELRGVSSAVLLTTSVFNVLGDVGTSLAAAGGEGIGTQLRHLKNLTGLTPEQKLNIQRFGNFTQEVGNAIHRGLMDDGLFSTKTQVAAGTTQKYSGVEYMTNKMREASWATITDEFLSAARKGDKSKLDKYFTPDEVRLFTEKVPEEWDPDTRRLFAAGVEQEAEQWVIMYGAQTRQLTTGKPGSVPTELLKTFTQFLPFVFQMGAKMHERMGKMSKLEMLKYTSQLTAYGIIMTAIGDSLRDIANNRTPRALALFEGGELDTEYANSLLMRTPIVSVLTLGIANEYSKGGIGGTPAFGIPNQFVMTLKKAAGDITEGEDPTGTLITGARKMTPNLPIPFVNRAIGDAIEEAISPRTYRDKRRKYEKKLRKNNQEVIFDY